MSSISFDAGSIIGTADLDRSPFNAGLDLAKADAEAWEQRTYKASLGADRTSADATVDAENAKLDNFGQKTVTATAKVDTGDDDEKLATENAALDAFGKRRDTATVNVDSSGADRGLEDIKNKAADAAGSDGLGLLLTTALSLGPALVPIGSVALAGLAAIAPMALAAGAGIGAFALAASGQLKGVETAAEGTLKNFQAMTAPTVFPVIAQSIGLVVPAFSLLVPLVSSTAGELSHLESAASSALTAPFWGSFISFIQSEAAPALGSFASLGGGILKAFAGLSVGLAPIISDVEGGMDGFAARIAAWGTTVGSSSGFASFLAYVEKEGPVVGGLLTSLAGTIGHLVVGLAPIGAVVLQATGALSKLLDVVTGISPVLTTIMLTVGGGLYAWSKISPLIDSAQAALLRFSTTAQGVEGVAGGSEGAIAGLVALVGGIAPAAALAGAGLVAVGALGAGLWMGFHGAVSQTVAAVEQLPTSTLPQLNTAIDFTKSRIDAAKTSLDDTNTSMGNVKGAANAMSAEMSNTSGVVSALTGYLAQLRGEEQQQNDNLGFLQNQFGLTRQSTLQLADSINLNLSKALTPTEINQFNAALDSMSAKAGLTGSALAQMATAGQVSASTLSTNMTAAATATQTAWASLGNAVTNFASATLPPTAAAIGQFYSESELQGAAFSQNIQAAIKAGYSPTLISSIIQAGPAQASQLLQGLVNAQGTGLQALITQATSAMSAEGAEAVEEARLTEVAVTAHSSTIAAALPTALALSQALTSTNAAAQVQVVAKGLTGGLPALEAIATEYGIALPNGLTAQVNAALLGGAAQAQAVAAAMKANQSSINDQAKIAAAAMPTAVVGAYGPAAIAGQGLMGQVAGGVTIAQGLVTTAVTNGAFVAAGAFTGPNAPNWGSLGESIDSGIAGGIAGGTGLVQIAVASLAGQTLLSGKKAINARSPSILFATEIGLPIAQGIAAGILAGGGGVAAAVGLIATQAVLAGRRIAIPTVGALGGVPGQISLVGGTEPSGPTAPSVAPVPTQFVVPPPNPNSNLDAITALAQGYANSRNVTLTSSPTISITVPHGTSAELVSAIKTEVATALADHDTALIAELEAIG